MGLMIGKKNPGQIGDLQRPPCPDAQPSPPGEKYTENTENIYDKSATAPQQNLSSELRSASARAFDPAEFGLTLCAVQSCHVMLVKIYTAILFLPIYRLLRAPPSPKTR